MLQRAGWKLNELGGGGWSWVEVEMSWVEVDGAGWRKVHGLVIPIKKNQNTVYSNLDEKNFTDNKAFWKTVKLFFRTK